jgi:predicted RNA binding protein YcfA (HicA-like mRNA interferase family)
MPKLRRLSGADLVQIFSQFGFGIHSQKGSHIKLRRVNASGERQTLTVPNHAQIDTGTAKAILH